MEFPLIARFVRMRIEMVKPKTKRKMVPMYSARDFCAWKKSLKPVGWMSDPDDPGPVFLDRKSWEELVGISSSGKGSA